MKCQPGEEGELVGIIWKNHPFRDFDGYADKEATKKKVIRGLLREGDLAFRSGKCRCLITKKIFGR